MLKNVVILINLALLSRTTLAWSYDYVSYWDDWHDYYDDYNAWNDYGFAILQIMSMLPLKVLLLIIGNSLSI